MKPKYMVHPSQARCIDSPMEQERLAAIGWLIAQVKPRTKMAARMRTLRERRRAEGWVNLTLWFEAQDLAAVRAARLPGETYSQLLVRLVNKQSLSQEILRGDADN